MKTVPLKMLFMISLLIIFSNNITAQSEEDLREIIEPLNAKFINSILEENLEEYLSIYTEDAVVMIPFVPTLYGRNALTVHWHNNMTKGDFVESVNVTTLDIWASEDLIYERGSYQITFKKYENKPKAVYGSYFSIWKQQSDGSYKMKYDISNLNHGV
jgi:ketosteroid isomerase-like protein